MFKIKKEEAEKLEIMKEHFKEFFEDENYREMLEYTKEKIEEVYKDDPERNKVDTGKLALYLAKRTRAEAGDDMDDLMACGLVAFALEDGVLDRVEIV